MKNNSIRFGAILVALLMLISVLYNVNWMYRSVFIASKPYIFAGGLVISLAIAQCVEWNVSKAISNGTLFGLVLGLVFLYSNQFWMYVTTKKID